MISRLGFVCLACLVCTTPTVAQTTVDLGNLQFFNGQNYENGANLNGASGTNNGDQVNTSSFCSKGAVFNNSYFTYPGSPPSNSWAGWSYSKQTNPPSGPLTPPDQPLNYQYSAYNLPNGGGAGTSPNYAVGYMDTFHGIYPTITLPTGTQPVSVQITNSTYAALIMLYGDPNGFARAFGTGDYFKLTITGLNAAGNPTGSVPFLLADYTSADSSMHYVISQWTTVDLSSLGPSTQSLMFSLVSTDQSFGFDNTPDYFALSNLVVTPVPEPALTAVLAGGGLVLWGLWRRRRRLDSRSPAATL